MGIREPNNVLPNIRNSDTIPINIISSIETNNMWNILYADAVDINGDEIVFIKSQNVSLNEFFGEYKTKILSQSYLMRFFNETQANSKTNTVNSIFATQFGFVSDNDCIIYIPRITFVNYNIIPQIDDVIYSKRTNQLFTITYVKDSPQKFQGSDLSYELKLKLYMADNTVIINQQVKNSVPNIDFLEQVVNQINSINNDKVDSIISDKQLIDNNEIDPRL